MAVVKTKCLWLIPAKEGSAITGVLFMAFAVVNVWYCISMHEPDEDLGRFHNIIWTARITDWLAQIANFILSGLMVYGVIKKKEKFLVWWLWYTLIAGICVGTILFFVVLMFLAFEMHFETILSGVILVLATVLVTHALQVVHSYRIELMVANSIPIVMIQKSASLVPAVMPKPTEEWTPPIYIPLK